MAAVGSVFMATINPALRMPDTLQTEREQIDPEEYNAIKQGLEMALDEVSRVVVRLLRSSV